MSKFAPSDVAPSVQLVQVECLSDDHFSGESDRAGKNFRRL